MKSKPPQPVDQFLTLSIIEGLIVAAVLLLIPSDPKNAFLFGYSRSRLVLLAFTLLLTGGFCFTRFHKKTRASLHRFVTRSSDIQKVAPWLGGAAALLLWLTIWMPPYRLTTLAAGFTRIQPVLIWFELILLQLALTVWLLHRDAAQPDQKGITPTDRKLLFLGAGLFALTLLLYILLARFSPQFSGNQLYFPPGAPITGLQVLAAWVATFLLFLLERRLKPRRSGGKVLVILAFGVIWVTAFVTWNSTPIPCTDDRPGPFPPNQVCYPAINDAVYSIGSHYITLGEGIYNHWMTDKPLYMAFLALSQGLAGQAIDDYLVVQVAVVALLPALAFLALRRKFGNAFALFVASLLTMQGAYGILLYREAGSVNVKLENPEVLTALFLLVLAFPVYHWIKDPTATRWAVLSGGVLSLSVLLRFNPIFIAPILVAVILWLKRRNLHRVLVPVLLFILAFGLVFGPWLLAARDAQGRNYYITKIEDVIASRFSRSTPQPQVETPSGGQSGTAQPQPTAPTAPSPLLTYDLGEVDKAGLSGIFYHFVNNGYSSLAKLPTTFTLHPIRDQVKSSIWTFTTNQPLWRLGLTTENAIALLFNLALVLTGILTAWKRFGAAGLTGLVIQLGYYAGNAVSQTSGGRYLEPVQWVVVIYYCLGIYTLTRLLYRRFTSRPEDERAGVKEDAPAIEMPAHRLRAGVWALLAGCLAAGLILPALNLLPSQLPSETDPALETAAYDRLVSTGLVTPQQWETFIQDPNHVIVQGMALHPRYYRGSFYRRGNLSFELMVLASDHVYVSYSPGINPRETFADGSKVLLAGCRLRRDSLWGALRMITETRAVVQLDNEGSTLVDPLLDWDCQ